MKSKQNIENTNQKLSKIMIWAEFICQLLCSMTYPYIYSQIMKQITDKYISVDSICVCVSTIIVNLLWNKYGNKLFKKYNTFCTIETISYIIATIVTILTYDFKFIFISDTLITSLITRNIICGRIKLRAKIHPTDVEREKYDNDSNTLSSIAIIVGSLISMVLSLDIRILLVISCISNTIDNFSYSYIWKVFNDNKKEEKRRS